MGFRADGPVRLLPRVAELTGKWRIKQIAQHLIALLIFGAVATALVLFFTIGPETWECLRQFLPGYLALASLFALVPWGCNTLRLMMWGSLLRRQMTGFEAFRIVVASEVASAVTPTAIGGGYVKLGLLVREGIPVGQAGFLMVLGSVIDALFFLIAIPAILLLSPSDESRFLLSAFQRVPGALWWILALLSFAISLPFVLRRYSTWLLAMCPFLGRWKERLQVSLHDFLESWPVVLRRGKSRLLLSLLLATLQWGCRYSIAAMLFMGLSLNAPFVSFFVRQWATFFSMTLVPTPGGSGGAEALFCALYTPFVPHYLLGVVTVGWRFFTFYFPVLIGLILVLTLFREEWLAVRDWRPGRRRDRDHYDLPEPGYMPEAKALK